MILDSIWRARSADDRTPHPAAGKPQMWLNGPVRLLWGWLLVSVAVLGAMLAPSAARADPPGRLLYEMAVVAADTRSQGWRGALYDTGGTPVEAQAGQRVSTPLGEFVNVQCGMLWDVCGMIRVDMMEWMKTHPTNTPTIGVSNDWVYRMYVSDETSAEPKWHSTLLHAGSEVAPDSAPIDTPMGPFRTGGPDAVGWARAGWFPVGWQPPS
jgi:hypothetical protein